MFNYKLLRPSLICFLATQKPAIPDKLTKKNQRIQIVGGYIYA